MIHDRAIHGPNELPATGRDATEGSLMLPCWLRSDEFLWHGTRFAVVEIHHYGRMRPRGPMQSLTWSADCELCGKAHQFQSSATFVPVRFCTSCLINFPTPVLEQRRQPDQSIQFTPATVRCGSMAA